MIDIKNSYDRALILHEELKQNKFQQHCKEIVDQINKELIEKVTANDTVAIRFAGNSEIYLQALEEIFKELIEQGYNISRDVVKISYNSENHHRFIFKLTQLSPQLEFNF